MIVKVRDHTLAVDVNGIYNVVSIGRITLSKTCEEAPPSSIALFPPTIDDNMHIEGCPPQHSAHDAASKDYEVSKLVYDRQT